MLAVRARPGEMPVADLNAGRCRFLLLRQRAGEGPAVLPGTRPSGVPAGPRTQRVSADDPPARAKVPQAHRLLRCGLANRCAPALEHVPFRWNRDMLTSF